MNLQEFRTFDAEARRAKPKLFMLPASEPRASDADIVLVESEIGVRLPESYREFLKEFGGGDFGLVTVLSANSDSEWYLPFKMSEYGSYLPGGVIPFCDDFTGGLYVFKHDGVRGQERVHYWTHETGVTETEFDNVFGFLARFGYGDS
ncbi:SMI1/KNR4 family protein [Ramlibacter albus]|uniref:SMI1/KNR4 family protein n=1 Tax=Ramlibacter albus TaxID=2079448 RepID=A0A923MED8_9BURK|nr:SMI1/KNR4 family protein [Ramlibacter albus]MBC5768490.1 SMI1/KNR4 family protein [Ramlibacter albus]